VQHDPKSRGRDGALRARGHSYGRALRGVTDRLLGVAGVLLQRHTLFDPAHGTYGIHTFDWTADRAARAKPAAMAANCAHPARMVLGPGGL